jgi:hypothetical protein
MVISMNKSDKKITEQKIAKVNPPTAKILPFDDGSKKKIK